MADLNRQVLLASRPTGQVKTENFKLVEAPLVPLADGELRVKNHFLSLDPYMRGRMNDTKSYAAPQELGAVMVGGTAGEVVESRNPHWQVGDHVVGMLGWQEFGTSDGTLLMKVDPGQVPLSAYLGVVGMPGVSAWFGLNKIIAPKPGETIVVSAASGAVGSVVGQLAKQAGCRVIGIAGGAEKCRYVTEELGLDACLDYKHGDLSTALQTAAPDGIDGYFDNVGGIALDAAMLNANTFARIAACGAIAGYDGEPTIMRHPMLIVMFRLKIEGFIVYDHLDIWPEALSELGRLVGSGALKYRETIAVGLQNAPEAFLGLLKGRNLGKQLVRLS